jgi:hypothetical protein
VKFFEVFWTKGTSLMEGIGCMIKPLIQPILNPKTEKSQGQFGLVDVIRKFTVFLFLSMICENVGGIIPR